MSLSDFKERVNSNPDVLIGIVVILVGFGSFGLGRLSVMESNQKPEIWVEEPQYVTREYEQQSVGQGSEAGAEEVLGQEAYAETPPEAGSLVGSKNSDKYHLPWCSGAQRIKEENKVWFSSVADAESRGYTAAANCPGL